VFIFTKGTKGFILGIKAGRFVLLMFIGDPSLFPADILLKRAVGANGVWWPLEGDLFPVSVKLS
jgi:hypothetical protein